MSREHLSIWMVRDAQEFPSEVAFVGSFKKLKKFTLDRYKVMTDEEDVEIKDETDCVNLLQDMDYEVEEICTITKDDFTENVIEVGVYYYIDDDNKKVYDTEEMTREFQEKLNDLTNE